MRHILFVLLFAAAVNAAAANSDATDAAFAALFSMPSAKPESGTWDFPSAEEFEPGKETRLIAYLARQKKAGANFNAYRHQGTLLHHAIRAALPKTAAWLLQNGADPHLKVRDSGSNALELSMDQKQTQTAQLLKQKYKMVLPPPAKLPAPDPVQVDEAAVLADAVAAAATDPAALTGVLARTPQASLDKHAGAIIRKIWLVARVNIDEKSGAILYSLPAESWPILWRRLAKPIDYGEAHGLGGVMAPELWPELLASGHSAKAEDALGCVPSMVSAKRFKSLWPQMIKLFPDVQQVAPRMVLAPYRFAAVSGCHDAKDDETTAKLAFLASVGARETVAGITDQSFERTSPALRAGAKPFIRPARPVVPNLVTIKPSCTFAMTDLWHDALGTKKDWRVDTVQLLEVPGEAQCAVLLKGDDDLYPPRYGVIDAFSGPQQDEPEAYCPDPTDAYEVWRQVGAHIVKTSTSLGHDNTADPITLVRHNVTGKRYYLNTGVQFGRCNRQRMPFAFEWRGGRLVESAPSELQNVLYEQCRFDGGAIACPGIAALSPGADAPADNASPFEGLSLESMLRERITSCMPGVSSKIREARYIAAALALDRKTVNDCHSKGISASATAKAIIAVSQSDLPLPEKRSRLAPLFYDHARLAAAFDAKWPPLLLDWLPYEDWLPVMKAIALFGPGGHARADDLRRIASEKNMHQLACDIDNARGWICGETISRAE